MLTLIRVIAATCMAGLLLIFLILLITGALMTAMGIPIFLVLCTGLALTYFMLEWAEDGRD
jgi:hypothetical protein